VGPAHRRERESQQDGAGQGVGLMTDVPTTAEVIDRLTKEYVAARARVMATPYPRS
jgi:NAD(P)H-dependent flavin oxidoreductase YrpB (nitropropane dioxygenase family)